jgi:hypothetical protein
MRSGALLLLVLAGCGGPLVDEGYLGEPLFKVRGQLLAMPAPVPGEERLHRASVFWSTKFPITAASELVEQTSVSTQIFLPDVFDVIFFRAPERQHFLSADPPFAVGVLLVYVDRDDNQRFTPPGDNILAGTTSEGFAFAPSEIGSDRSPTGATLPAGFSVIALPASCPMSQGQPAADPEAPAPRTCGGCTNAELCDPVHQICVPSAPLSLYISDELDFSAVPCG